MMMLRHLESMLMCDRNSNLTSVKICFSKMKDWNSDFFDLSITTYLKLLDKPSLSLIKTN